MLDKYPQVGVLKKKAAEKYLPDSLEMLMERVPFYSGTPMIVHFPMVFSIVPLFFYLLFILTGMQAFETTAFHCLGSRYSIYSAFDRYRFFNMVGQLSGKTHETRAH